MSVKDWVIKKLILAWIKKQKEAPVFKFLEGKKTFFTMAVIIILGGLEAYNQHCGSTGSCSAFDVPGWVFSILGALGIYTRAIAKPK